MAPYSSILAWKNSMNRGAWWAKVHGIAKSWILLSECTHTHTHTSQLIHTQKIENNFKIAAFSKFVTSIKKTLSTFKYSIYSGVALPYRGINCCSLLGQGFQVLPLSIQIKRYLLWIWLAWIICNVNTFFIQVLFLVDLSYTD